MDSHQHHQSVLNVYQMFRVLLTHHDGGGQSAPEQMLHFWQIISDADAPGQRTELGATVKAHCPYCIKRKLRPRVGRTLA